MNFTHPFRLNLVRHSLDGLALGDALGRQLFAHPSMRSHHRPPPPPWRYTDDTRMALAIAHTLQTHHHIHQDHLAHRFAQDFLEQPERGYGAVAHFILHQIAHGTPWPQASTLVYSGTGSKGNGAAMRASVVGAYFL